MLCRLCRPWLFQGVPIHLLVQGRRQLARNTLAAHDCDPSSQLIWRQVWRAVRGVLQKTARGRGRRKPGGVRGHSRAGGEFRIGMM